MMSIWVIVTFATTFLLALISSCALLFPFFGNSQRQEGGQKEPLLEVEKDELANLLVRKETLFRELEELEQDYLSKKTSHHDYQWIKSQLMRETSDCMLTIDRLAREHP